MEERLRLALLAAIVAAYLAFGVAYAVKTPTWETPDEPAHFNYVRHLAGNLQIPVLQIGDYDQAYLEKLKASKFPPDLSVDSVRYESWQPPFYYLLATPFYWLSRGLPLNQQVIVLRLFSVLLGALLLLVSYGIARRVFPKDNIIALAVPGFIAVLPQHVAMTAAVSNDTLAELVISTILFVLVGRICLTDALPEGLEAVPSPFAKGEGQGEGLPKVPRQGDPLLKSLPTQTGSRRSLSLGLGHTVLLGVLLGIALLTKTTIYVAAALIPLGLLLREYLAGDSNVGEARRGLPPAHDPLIAAASDDSKGGRGDSRTLPAPFLDGASGQPVGAGLKPAPTAMNGLPTPDPRLPFPLKPAPTGIKGVWLFLSSFG